MWFFTNSKCLNTKVVGPEYYTENAVWDLLPSYRALGPSGPQGSLSSKSSQTHPSEGLLQSASFRPSKSRSVLGVLKIFVPEGSMGT